MRIRLHDGTKTIARFDTDELPYENLWLEREDGETVGSLFFGGDGELVSLGQYDAHEGDWVERAVIRKTVAEIHREKVA